MSRKLMIVAVSGLVLGTICIAAAAVIGGPELHNRDWSDFNLWDGQACNVELAGRMGRRTLAWQGGDHVAISIPATVQYRRGQGDQLVMEGDENLLPLVQINDGGLRTDCRLRGKRQHFTVTLPGRAFASYDLKGLVMLTLDDLDQPRLDIDIAGSATVTATGRADALRFDVAGSGKGHFADLAANAVTIDIKGSGDAEVRPRERLDVSIAGSGRVALLSEPTSIQTSIMGSGRITHTDGSVTRASGFSHRSDNRAGN